MNFREKGGGSLQSEKFCCRFQYLPKKSATQFSENRVGGGGARGRLELFRTFIEFGPGSHPLSSSSSGLHHTCMMMMICTFTMPECQFVSLAVLEGGYCKKNILSLDLLGIIYGGSNVETAHSYLKMVKNCKISLIRHSGFRRGLKSSRPSILNHFQVRTSCFNLFLTIYYTQQNL